jgi:hypothetical protein
VREKTVEPRGRAYLFRGLIALIVLARPRNYQERRGMRIAEHLKLVLNIIDRQVH